MCKCRFLEDANMDAYLLDNMTEEESTLQDMIRSTLDDFANTVDRLSRKPDNEYLICHLYDLMQLMNQEDCFHFMETDPDTYVREMLELHGLSLARVVTIACRSKRLR